MTSKTTPRGHGYSFTHDGLGRITHYLDPSGGSKTLALTQTSADAYSVSVTTGEGRTTTYGVELLPGGDSAHQVNTFPTGLSNQEQTNADGSRQVTFADGTAVSRATSPDPRWLMRAPVPQSTMVTVPSGPTRTSTTTRSVTLSDPDNLLSLQSETETTVVNGRTYTSVYDVTTRRQTHTSPAGRVTVVEIDGQGRVVWQEPSGLYATSYVYNGLGQLVTVTQGAGVDARVTTMTYNPQGHVDTITDPLGRVTSFVHDAAGRATQETLPGGRVVQLVYDLSGNMTAITPPDRTAHQFGYTPVDRVQSYTPPDLGLGPTTTTYLYDLDHLPLQTRGRTGRAWSRCTMWRGGRAR